MSKTVRLRHRSVLFCDPETGFEISGDEVLDFPRKVGSLTRAWLQGGGLLVGESLEEASPEAQKQEAEPNPKRIFSDEEIREMSHDDLLALVKELGLRTPRNSKRRESLVEALKEYQDRLKSWV